MSKQEQVPLKIMQATPKQEVLNETEIGCWLLRLWDIDAAGSKFSASLKIIYKFRVPNILSIKSFASANDRTYFEKSELSEFMPGQAVEFTNAISTTKGLVQYYGDPADELIFHSTKDGPLEDGIVTAEVPIEGTFRFIFDLRAFPYDHQRLKIGIRHWRKFDLDFKRQWKTIPTSNYTLNKEMLTFTDWDIHVKDLGYDVKHGPPTDIEYIIPICRKPWFYSIAVSSSLAIIVAFAILAMFTDPDPSNRLSYVTGLILAAVAVKFTVAGDLPRVPYCTTIDYEYLATLFFLLGCSLTYVVCDDHEKNNAAKPYVIAGGIFVGSLFFVQPVIYLFKGYLRRLKQESLHKTKPAE